MSRKWRVLFVLGILAVLTAGCGASAQPQAQPPVQVEVIVVYPTPMPTQIPAPTAVPLKLDDTPRIALISAFDGELYAFRDEGNIEETLVVDGRTVYMGTLAGHDVLMTISGVSMVNATQAVTTLIERFNITHIVFSGIAGGVNPDLRIGDVAVPARWAEYQENYFARETSGGFAPPPWVTPIAPNFGMMFPSCPDVVLPGSPPDLETTMCWWNADPTMLQVAQQVATSIELERCVDADHCLSETPVVRVGGNGVAGPTFVDNAEYRSYVWDVWRADSLDMESSAVAHVATDKHVPFIIFRSLSDLAGGGPGENEIGTFFGIAATNSARVMLAFLEAWP
ncbi:hypothetical protein A2V56_00345 [Candidatus Woesebacteria bacterium RBG_19FT_COMBO_42_9]|uniref:Nucleoside phosphorylase domain-containing protein n=1 Tax=Candidatus Woesebacteria bacterium RBG_16_42_24 TaxID=1802485 RepID=A0A1F7XJD6_9BACT|nr:MAG: hypothetical protein A2V97_00270 [Candidatus Woesebacteria bacterium RBG_16_42_24]OGM17453.1 MAG: hypothetical protein A2V56_00345 [Candidatus Woesebacteria bacterium RBG_19FT_COMBO_42_9]